MNSTLSHAGLWGDGDEVEAIELIEKRLGVELRDEDAPKVWTVGDLWDCLLNSNENLRDNRKNWIRFVIALTAFTGLDPRKIGRGTLLIEPKEPGLVTKIWKRLAGNGRATK